MKAKITIDMGNAAFADDNEGTELARILRKLADRLDGTTILPKVAPESLFDFNGNKVGEFEVAR